MSFSLPLAAHVTLKTKLTDSIYSPGDQVKIEWEVLVEHDPVDWDLYYSDNGGESWEAIEEGIPIYQLEYTWIAPDLDSRKMLVRIVQDNEVTEDYDEVSDTFAVISTMTAVFEQSVLPFFIEINPNPVNSELLARLDMKKTATVSWELFNSNGQSVKDRERLLFNKGSHQLKANTTNFAMGTYILLVAVDDRLKSFPFVVSR